MTIEDRVRRLMTVVGLVAGRGRGGARPVAPAPTTTPPPTTAVSTAGWKTYTDAAHNLRLRYPPDWVARKRNAEGTVTLAPPEHARKVLARWPPFAVTVTAGGSYYLGEVPEPGFVRGRLPGGQAYLYFQSDPATLVQWPGAPPVPANVADRRRSATWSIDWGRDCKGIHPYRCGPHGVSATVYAGSTPLWDRYRAVAEAIVRSTWPVTPTRPSRGDRSLPRCRSDQWRVVWTGEHGTAGQRFFLSGGVRSLGGQPCHEGPGPAGPDLARHRPAAAHRRPRERAVVRRPLPGPGPPVAAGGLAVTRRATAPRWWRRGRGRSA